MGLSLTVGMLADPSIRQGESIEDLDRWNGTFDAVNRVLAAAGLPAHKEPTDDSQVKCWCCDLAGYSSLHYLRRIAAHLWAKNTLPPPGDDNASEDPLTARYYDSLGRRTAGVFASVIGRGRPAGPRFDHLMFHSDCEGFYVPIEFDEVLFPGDEDREVAGPLGSSHRLSEECEIISRYLGLPLELDPESEEVWQLLESQGRGDVTWRRYGVESFTCLRLHHAARRSIESGAAIVFC